MAKKIANKTENAALQGANVLAAQAVAAAPLAQPTVVAAPELLKAKKKAVDAQDSEQATVVDTEVLTDLVADQGVVQGADIILAQASTSSGGAAGGAAAGGAAAGVSTTALVVGGLAVAAAASGGSSSSPAAAAPAPTPTPTPTPTPVALTTAVENKFGTSANDSFTATDLTLNAGDIIADSSTTDSDSLVVNVTAGTVSAGAAVTVVGIENVSFNYDTSLKTTTNVSGIVGTTITINQNRANGSPDADVSNVGNVTLKAGTGVTGAFNVTSAVAGSAVVIDSGSATSVASTTVTTGSTTITGGSKLATISAVGKTATITTGASSSTVTLEGTTATTDTATVSAGTAMTLDTDGAGGQGIETLNLSGNGASTTVTYGTIAAPAATVNFTGTQSVTLVGTGAQFTGATITDNTTGTATTTVSVSATGGATVDLSKASGVDKFIITAVTAGDDLKLAATGTVVQVNATANALDLVSAAAASTTTDTVTVIGNGATTVLGNGTASTGGGTDVFNTVNYSANAANTLTATLGTETTLNVSGSKNVTLDATTTAKAVVATELTGNLSVTYDNTSDIATATGGSGDDSFTVTTAPTTRVTANGGAGNDSFTALTTSVATFDGGTGYDTLTLAGDVASVQFSNVERVSLSGAVSAAKISDYSGKTFTVTGAQNFVFGNTAANNDSATVDLSTLVLDDAALVSKFTTDFGTNGYATTISAASSLNYTGSRTVDEVTGTGNADIISTGAGADVIVGGAGADTITGGEGADTITGGTGVDSIILTETTSAQDTVISTVGGAYTTATADNITGFAFGAGKDIFQVDISDSTAIANLGIVTAGNGATAIAGNLVIKEVTVGTGATLAATDEIAVMVGGTFADNTALLNSISVNGNTSTSDIVWSAAPTATNGLLIFYTNGTNGYLVAVSDADAGATAAMEYADLAATTIAVFSGVTSITAGMVNTVNFAAIA